MTTRNDTEADDIATVRQLLIRRLIEVLQQDNPKASALAVAARFLSDIGMSKPPSLPSPLPDRMPFEAPRDDEPPAPPSTTWPAPHGDVKLPF